MYILASDINLCWCSHDDIEDRRWKLENDDQLALERIRKVTEDDDKQQVWIDLVDTVDNNITKLLFVRSE